MTKFIYCLTTAVSVTVSIEMADVPPELRQQNWQGTDGSGSCVNASTVTCLQWAGRHQEADLWKATWDGGETLTSHMQHLDQFGLPYSLIVGLKREQAEAWLEWAIRNRLVIGMIYGYRHAQNLVDLNQEYAVVLDNNQIDKYRYVTREAFFEEFEKRGGIAWVFLLPPSPPWPILQ